jgi:hypothetical protein
MTRGRGPAQDQACGTYRGYYRHRRRSEQACRPCLDALNRHQNDQRQAAHRREQLLEALAGFDRYPTGRRERAA